MKRNTIADQTRVQRRQHALPFGPAAAMPHFVRRWLCHAFPSGSGSMLRSGAVTPQLARRRWRYVTRRRRYALPGGPAAAVPRSPAGGLNPEQSLPFAEFALLFVMTTLDQYTVTSRFLGVDQHLCTQQLSIHSLPTGYLRIT